MPRLHERFIGRIRAMTRGIAFAALATVLSCGEHPGQPLGDDGAFTITVHTTASVTGVSVEVTAADIPSPIVENLPITNGTASGTVHIPAGSDRLITVHAFDENAIETHRGHATADVHPGQNLALAITLDPLTGDVPIIATIATYTVTLTPPEASIVVGETLQYTVAVADVNGPVADPAVAWGSTNPVVAPVDAAGLAAGTTAGTATVSATYRGVVALATLTVTDAPPVLSRIVFQTDRDGNDEIYVMNEDGSSPVNLTNNGAADLSPVLSPDGAKIAFLSDRSGSNEVYVMNVDGSGVVDISADAAATESDQEWSPDGTKLIWGSSASGNIEIYVANADGTGRTNLTNDAALDLYPAWSPDGTKIAFVSTRSGNFDIWVMNADGSSPTQLTTHTGADLQPDWSPDGSTIAYLSQPIGATYTELMVMNADGSSPTVLITPDEAFSMPTWSPDGSRIGFLSWVTGGNYEIYVIDPDGTDRSNVTATTQDEMGFAWSPDGSCIVFDQQVGINPDESVDVEVFTVNVDGTGMTNLTNNAAYDTRPSWGPPPP